MKIIIGITLPIFPVFPVDMYRVPLDPNEDGELNEDGEKLLDREELELDLEPRHPPALAST